MIQNETKQYPDKAQATLHFKKKETLSQFRIEGNQIQDIKNFSAIFHMS